MKYRLLLLCLPVGFSFTQKRLSTSTHNKMAFNAPKTILISSFISTAMHHFAFPIPPLLPIAFNVALPAALTAGQFHAIASASEQKQTATPTRKSALVPFFLLASFLSILATTITQFLLSPTPSPVISHALLASYIGGSLNFAIACKKKIEFATMAKFAVADCAVMGLYLSVLDLKNIDSGGFPPPPPPPQPQQQLSALSTTLSIVAMSTTILKLVHSLPDTFLTTLQVFLLTTIPTLLPKRPAAPYKQSSDHFMKFFYSLLGFSLPLQAISLQPFVHVSAILSLHLLFTLSCAKLLFKGTKSFEIRLAANAAVGGAATACQMAASSGRFNLVTPAFLVGSAGYMVGNVVGRSWLRFFL